MLLYPHEQSYDYWECWWRKDHPCLCSWREARAAPGGDRCLIVPSRLGADQRIRAKASDSGGATDRWLIDGFGPWDQIEERARLADTIIFVDHPIWVHFWWACERQMSAALGEQRVGGPPDCDLRDVTKQMFETLWWVHENLRPKVVELVEMHQAAKTVVWIRSPEELDTCIARLRSDEQQ